MMHTSDACRAVGPREYFGNKWASTHFIYNVESVMVPRCHALWLVWDEEVLDTRPRFC